MTGSPGGGAVVSGRRGPGARVLMGAVRAYQLIVSPWMAPRCRYHPSCSAYAVDALGTHGAVRGTVIAGWRLLRCNPWSRGGVDPVPARWRDALTRDPAARWTRDETGDGDVHDDVPPAASVASASPDRPEQTPAPDPTTSSPVARARTLDARTSRAQAHG